MVLQTYAYWIKLLVLLSILWNLHAGQRVVHDSFEVSKEGVVSTAGPLNPKDTNYITVALTYQAIGVSGRRFQGHATTRVIISVKGE